MSDKMQDKIKKLALEKNAVILAHYYCRPEIHDVADYVGDSLGLSQTAQSSAAKLIIFAGVHFMAETASILCPEKKVVLVNENAGCPMADMITAEALRAKKAELPGVPVLTYVNSSAEVKTESDICCTSANVVAVLRSLPEKRILMTPDCNLAAYAQTKVPEKEIIIWEGLCPTHHRIRSKNVLELKTAHPGALVVAHPECRPEVLALADQISSTSGIISFCRTSTAQEFIILTEGGVLYPLQKENPTKKFYYPEGGMECPNMKKNTLADVLSALENEGPEVKVSPEIRKKALIPIQKMMAVPRD